MRDGNSKTDIGVVDLHGTEGTQWLTYLNEIFFDSHGCPAPKTSTDFNIERNGKCVFFLIIRYKEKTITELLFANIIYQTKKLKTVWISCITIII